MARLSRTAKYADLRNQMSQDRETSIYTEELGKFEDKLKDIQSSANGVNENILKRDTQEVAFVGQTPTPVVVNQTPVIEPTPVKVEPVVVNQAPVIEPTPVKVEPVVVNQTPVVEPTPVIEKPTPVIEPTPVKVEPTVVKQEPIEVKDSFKEETKEFKPSEANEDFFAFLNSLDTTNFEQDIQESIDNVVTPEPVVEEAPVVEQPVIIEAPKKEPEIINVNNDSIFDIVDLIEKDNIELNGEIEQVKEKEIPTIGNDFINETIKEIDNYNKNDGRKTIDELSTSFVEAVRHPENNAVFNSDDEFSNTVSLEIDKVLSEIKTEAAAVVKEVIKEATVKEEVDVVADVKPISNTIEQPVVKQEEVVEIKSMEETLKQDVLDDTIPFVMNNDEEGYDDYEDEAPNKILNVILVVLIVILLAILGVIVYYILYAKGIIG